MFFFKIFFNENQIIFYIFSLLLFLNPCFLYFYINCWGSNLAALVFFFSFVRLLDFKEKNFVIHLILALFFLGIISSYPEISIFLGSFILILLIFSFLRKNFSIFYDFAFILLFSLIISFPIWIQHLKYLYHLYHLAVFSKIYGDIYKFHKISEIFGLSFFIFERFKIFPYFVKKFSLFIETIAWIICFFCILGFIKSFKKSLTVFSLGLTMIVALFYLFFVKYPYGFQKTLYFNLPLIYLLSALGIEKFKIIKKTLYGLLLFIFIINVINSSKFIQIVKRSYIPLQPIIEISEFFNKKVLSKKSIYLDIKNNTKMMWFVYFLDKFPLHLGHYTEYILKEHSLSYRDFIDDDFVLKERNKDNSKYPLLPLIYKNSEYLVFQNMRFFQK